jgi:hypothetical protein
MPSTLWVQGFNTKNKDTYDGIYQELKTNNHHVTIFSYDNTENNTHVLKNLEDIINKNKFDYIMGHSMGGGFVMRYIFNNPDILKKTKVFLFMSLLYKEPIYENISKSYLIKNSYLPQGLFLPSFKLYSHGNIFNDTYKLLPLKQICGMYNDIMLDNEELIYFLQKNKSVRIIYAEKEAFNTIPQDVLDKLPNVTYVKGLHECFNSTDGTEKTFFKTFKKLI